MTFMNAFDVTSHVPGWGLSEPVSVDCGTCAVRSKAACDDCVVTCLLGPHSPEDSLNFADDERQALDVLAGSGLVPPLRLVVALPDPQFPAESI